MLNHFQVKEYEGKRDSSGKKIMINPNDVISSYTEGIPLTNSKLIK